MGQNLILERYFPRENVTAKMEVRGLVFIFIFLLHSEFIEPIKNSLWRVSQTLFILGY